MTEENFEAMLDASVEADAGISVGQKVEAKVVSLGKEYIFLDLGTRSEGMILREELEKDGELTVAEGDVITVITSAVRDGALMCAIRMGQGSIERTDDKSELMAQVKDAYDAGMPVEGLVKEVNKGGFQVDIFGLGAFCPVSQISLGYCETPEEHVGKTYSFTIIKFEEGGRNVVISRKPLLEEEAKAAAEEAWKTLGVGTTHEGTVSSLKPYGAFVNIGGVDGLVHVSEISHTRINHPEEVLAVGQVIKVQIKDLNPETRKISLSIKSMESDPWDETLASLTTGSVRMGKVTRLANFGAFVEVSAGVEGLVHISRLGAGRRISTPKEVVSPGDEIKIRILEIDPDSRRISLERVDDAAEEEKALTESFRESAKSSSGGMGTLGDILSKKLK